MLKGIIAAVAAAQDVHERSGGVGSLLQAAGDAWAARAGGTSGALWGAALQAAGARLGNSAAKLDATDAADAVGKAIERIQELGRATLGDKTMLDAAIPFYNSLRAVLPGSDLITAWGQAASVAADAAEGTKDLRPRLGRARPLAERSVGTPDAGAVSFALCVARALDEVARSTADPAIG
jgi:dihydroxyacetone kinase